MYARKFGFSKKKNKDNSFDFLVDQYHHELDKSMEKYQVSHEPITVSVSDEPYMIVEYQNMHYLLYIEVIKTLFVG